MRYTTKYIFYLPSICNTIMLHWQSLSRLFRHTLVLFIMLFSISQTACNTPKHLIGKAYKKMNTTEKQLADSMIAYALDHEAIYTLLDTLKPMSSVQFYRMPVLSTNKLQRDSAQQAITAIQHVVNQLSIGDYQFVFNPFERTDSIYRNIEVYIFRKSRLQSLINTHSSFYNQWGITATANPATILAITEYENKYDRWRSYGYLFGYPDYAVDFFVQAGKSQDSTKEFIQRDFFAIPVYAGEKGHFTYAVPKGYQTTQTDSMIYNKAKATLENYKKIRTIFYDKNNRSPIKLWRRSIK